MKGKLYLIPTVIADDTEESVLSPQIKEVVAGLDYFLVENVRTARRYISKLKLGLVIENLAFELLDKKTKREVIDQYLEKVMHGKDVGVISESGCPGVADPGAEAVALAHQKGIQVVPLVGPSSILMALMGSGFNGQSFAFHGYIPIKKPDLIAKIKDMEKNALQLGQTQLFMDTPYRNQKLFEELLSTCNGETQLSVAKGISGQEEYIKTLKIKEWKKKKIDLHKVPTIFSICS
ncbi:SAM-dependent methyltransferase [Reichenbachiella agarivorans]|uniref:SAM-dependent methyltransferase n=1 Tax=Reichenbachiella agarivorans TaxID=2979464 RepID=A0ABY6CT55_9BACT|nr:SAM-dependent methyltransferase [Reichenbachiella agarivorans]UXP33695.1 SAM-dependent methyltransferase [Reichenbachiella agarivorans]